MEIEKYMDLLHLAGRLKDATRHCDTTGGRRESVADHTFRAALMAMFMRDEFPTADMDKVIRMLLVHDLGEAFTGDIPSFLKTKEDEEREDALLYAYVEALPEPYGAEIRALLDEMNARETIEAKIYKAIDGMEAVIQHNESDIRSWTELEHHLNLSYATERVKFSPYLTSLRAAIRRDTEKKLTEAGVKFE